MKLLESLTPGQKVILLFIAGIVSLVGLDGLSYYRRDYYVSAAVLRAFFVGILLLSTTSPLLFILRKDGWLNRGWHKTMKTSGLRRWGILFLFGVVISLLMVISAAILGF